MSGCPCWRFRARGGCCSQQRECPARSHPPPRQPGSSSHEYQSPSTQEFSNKKEERPLISLKSGPTLCLRLLQHFQPSNRANIVATAVIIAMTVPIIAMILRLLLLGFGLPLSIVFILGVGIIVRGEIKNPKRQLKHVLELYMDPKDLVYFQPRGQTPSFIH